MGSNSSIGSQLVIGEAELGQQKRAEDAAELAAAAEQQRVLDRIRTQAQEEERLIGARTAGRKEEIATGAKAQAEIVIPAQTEQQTTGQQLGARLTEKAQQAEFGREKEKLKLSANYKILVDEANSLFRVKELGIQNDAQMERLIESARQGRLGDGYRSILEENLSKVKNEQAKEQIRLQGEQELTRMSKGNELQKKIIALTSHYDRLREEQLQEGREELQRNQLASTERMQGRELGFRKEEGKEERDLRRELSAADLELRSRQLDEDVKRTASALGIEKQKLQQSVYEFTKNFELSTNKLSVDKLMALEQLKLEQERLKQQTVQTNLNYELAGKELKLKDKNLAVDAVLNYLNSADRAATPELKAALKKAAAEQMNLNPEYFTKPIQSIEKQIKDRGYTSLTPSDKAAFINIKGTSFLRDSLLEQTSALPEGTAARKDIENAILGDSNLMQTIIDYQLASRNRLNLDSIGRADRFPRLAQAITAGIKARVDKPTFLFPPRPFGGQDLESLIEEAEERLADNLAVSPKDREKIAKQLIDRRFTPYHLVKALGLGSSGKISEGLSKVEQ